MINNQKGILAFDFLVGFMMITSFFMLLVMLSFTLSVVESMQYIAFATARTYYAADVSKQAQEDAAISKYNHFKEGVLKGLLRDNWFDMQEPNFPDFNGDGIEDGVKIDFTAKVLSFTLPFFLGKTGESNTFTSNVNAYIGREPSWEECDGHQRRRLQMILNLNPNLYQDNSNLDLNAYMPGDNGC